MSNEKKDYGRLFLTGLERWERPSGRGDDQAAQELSAGAVAARFLRGLEGWEWPLDDSEHQEIVLRTDPGVAAVMRLILLQAKASVEVIAARPGGVWAGVPVLIEKVGGGIVRAARLDTSGRSQFTDVEPGQYHVIAGRVSGSLGTYGAVLHAADERGDRPVGAAPEQTFQAQNLHISVTLKPDAEIALTFSTEDPNLAGGVIRFAFAEAESGKVQLSGRVELEAQPGQLNRWAGQWQYHLAVTEMCELLFGVEIKKMTVEILGAMVPQIVAYDAGGENQMPAVGWPIRLILTELKSRRTPDSPAIYPTTDKMIPSHDFTKALEDAFSWWERGDVTWTIESCDWKELPVRVNGPSLGGAFAVGLALLHYRGDDGEMKRLRNEDKGLADSFAYADFSEVIVSAKVISDPGRKREAVKLGGVGGAKYKIQGAGGRPIVFSVLQPELDTKEKCVLIEVETVRDAIDKVFQGQGLNLLRAL